MNATRDLQSVPEYMSQLSIKGEIPHSEEFLEYKAIYQKSDLYVPMVAMMFIFYGIPAVQLVIG